jgi:hypothetical protein
MFFQGLEEPAKLSAWSQRAVNQLHEIKLTPLLHISFSSLLRELNCLIEERKRIEADIASLVLPAPGIVPPVSSFFCTEIFVRERFATAKAVSRLFRSLPHSAAKAEGAKPGKR